jgi:segregation and condensation protein B
MAEHLKPIIEALIFASPEPLTDKTLFKLLEGEPKEDVEAALALLKLDYDRPSGLQLVEVAGGYQIVTRPELHEYVRRLFKESTSSKLSVKALETLAVIAYKQPITAPEITEIRGVNSSGILNTLIERKLVKIVGRKAVVGRPFMYATTREFLDKFGLNDINDLPKVEDLADVLGFDPPSLDSEPTATPLAFDFDSSADGAPAEGGESAVESVAEAAVAAEGESEEEAEAEASGDPEPEPEPADAEAETIDDDANDDDASSDDDADDEDSSTDETEEEDADDESVDESDEDDDADLDEDDDEDDEDDEDEDDADEDDAASDDDQAEADEAEEEDADVESDESDEDEDSDRKKLVRDEES